ncbi:ABC transporter ATP-binding protein [Streptomyces sp. NBC_01237]|uniref:ABC transporter ATP-binding protein n=1 Tax=Streptomyces sp. NBC_01237 TaxID=2903790 RepID=UPI002DD8614A|nr:ABC transporter ATP-binding protein [Streptomyces sp. NBC_01237]WRZ78293.1 ABC transporter ATP-binding protein [Streptomyces sp. NBC_01237]
MTEKTASHATTTSHVSAAAATRTASGTSVAAATTADASGTKQPGPRLRAEDLTLSYDQRTVATHLGVDIPDNSFTVIIGPNACGKSTLLKALARMLKPRAGQVQLDGAPIGSYRSREVARRLGLLPQSSTAPGGITVGDLVARGRYPHQGMLKQWSAEDEAAVVGAMEQTGVLDLADRSVDDLSGGQRQRVWLSMVLAQQTSILLLDEPTTFLDIAHQVEVLDLCADLHARKGHTVVAVLHDLNQACRYATHLIVMRPGGTVAAEGDPATVMTAELVEDVFGLPCRIIDDPETGSPLMVPAAPRRYVPQDSKAEHGAPEDRTGRTSITDTVMAETS